MPEPACCPNSYVRPIDGGLEIEDGSERCCGPEGHVLLNVEEWHDAMYRWEQELLDEHIRAVLPPGTKLPVVVDVPVMIPVQSEYITIKFA